MRKVTWQTLVLSALRNRQVASAHLFSEDGDQEHLAEIEQMHAISTLVRSYDSAQDLLRDLDMLRNRVQFEFQSDGGRKATGSRWTREAVGIPSNGKVPRALEYPDGVPAGRRRRA